MHFSSLVGDFSSVTMECAPKKAFQIGVLCAIPTLSKKSYDQISVEFADLEENVKIRAYHPDK